MNKIAIHHRKSGFSECWIEYCNKNKIPYKLVNCYENDIIRQLDDCDVLMWHFHHAVSRDVLFARKLLHSLEHAGVKVFPDIRTAWHFDDKIAQKYLLEAINAPLVPTFVFYNKTKALEWSDKTEYPKVFKLRKGAGSSNVKLVPDRKSAKRLIYKAFGRGFRQYQPVDNLKERWRKYKEGKVGFWHISKGVIRLGYRTDFDRVAGRERGYVYFQDYVPGNDFDVRVIVIDGKAFAIKRMVRKGDFRASGSGDIKYAKVNFDEITIRKAFDLADKLKSQCLAIDFVYDNDNPLIVEVSYGYSKEGYLDCTGYWDREMNWHEGKFNPQYWMVDAIVKSIHKNSTAK